MAEVTLNRTQIDLLVNRDEQIQAGIQRLVEKAIPAIIDEAPEFSGDLRDNIFSRRRDRQGRFGYEIVANVRYALFIVRGRNPGGKFPPYRDSDSDFVQWCEAKGIDPYLAARAIVRNGIEPNNFLERGLLRAGRL